MTVAIDPTLSRNYFPSGFGISTGALLGASTGGRAGVSGGDFVGVSGGDLGGVSGGGLAGVSGGALVGGSGIIWLLRKRAGFESIYYIHCAGTN